MLIQALLLASGMMKIALGPGLLCAKGLNTVQVTRYVVWYTFDGHLPYSRSYSMTWTDFTLRCVFIFSSDNEGRK